MKILLTGATGFIGSFFYLNYQDKFEIKSFSFQKDLNTLNIKNIDTLVHLSALVHQMDGALEEAYESVNVRKTIALAKKAKESGVKRFVFMSSIKVYGEENNSAYNEKTSCHPRDPYGKSKLDAEEALMALQDKTFSVAIIRTPIVYGEGVKANILKLVELVDKCRILPFGGIHNRRSMIYVGNLAHLIVEIIKQKKNGIFLASDDHPISTSEFIQDISKALDKRTLLITFLPLKIILKRFKPQLYHRLYGDLYINNNETRTLLNLHNPFTRTEGIERMIKWYKGNT